MPQKGFTTVTIPITLWDRAKKLVKTRPDLGFVSPTDFVRDAIRKALEKEEPR